MKTIIVVALAGAFLATTALSLAAASSPTSVVPRCESTGDRHSKARLSSQLHLGRKILPIIDLWNGCLKVTYWDRDGSSHMEFYDPDSLSRVGQ